MITFVPSLAALGNKSRNIAELSSIRYQYPHEQKVTVCHAPAVSVSRVVANNKFPCAVKQVCLYVGGSLNFCKNTKTLIVLKNTTLNAE